MYKNTAKGLAALGRKGDTMLMHVNPNEVAVLSKILGPVSTNPSTGLPEASNWDMALNMLGGLATGVGGLGVGASVAGPAQEWAMNQFGEGVLSDIVGKAAPVVAGAGLGATIGGITGGKYGALGLGLQGGLSGGLGGLEAENILGTGGVKTPTDISIADGGPATPATLAAERADLQNQAMSNIMATDNAPAQQTASVMDNLAKYPNRFSSWDSMKNLTKDYGGPLFSLGMVGQGVAGMGDTEDAYNQQKRKQQLEDYQREKEAEETYQRIYGGQGIGVNYADGGPVRFNVPGPMPISMTIPEKVVDEIHDAGGIGNLVREYGARQMAQGGYINLQPMGETAYPQSQIARAQPYAAASPQRREVVQGYNEGGFLDGEGDGMSDDIDADIEGEEPIRVADGEFVIPRHLVEQVGGPDRLDELLKEIRRRAYGSEEQIKQDAAKQATMDMLGEE